MNESQHSTMMGNPSRWCPEVHMAGSWQVAGHSVVNKASQDTSTQNYWDGSLHQGPRWAQRVGVMSLCESWPRTWAGVGLWLGNQWAQQLGTAASGGRADTVGKRHMVHSRESQLVSKLFWKCNISEVDAESTDFNCRSCHVFKHMSLCQRFHLFCRLCRFKSHNSCR